MMATSDLQGRFAVVTGASSGIGAAIARALAVAGAHVLVHYRSNQAGATETVRFVKDAGREAAALAGDLCRPEDRKRLFEYARQWTQEQLDIWVNNAGADVLTGAAAEGSFDEKLEQLWQVDVRATIDLSRQFVRHHQNRTSAVPESRTPRAAPSLINVGWDQAQWGMEGDSGEMFATTKGAIMAFTKSLAKTAGPSVRVNCVAPGWIKTAWGLDAPEYWERRAIQESILSRWGSPDDVARGVRFLASDESQFMTGQWLEINGGWNSPLRKDPPGPPQRPRD